MKETKFNQDTENEKLVLVTGGTGYIAGWIIKKFLEKGYQVNTTVRNLKNNSKTKYLQKLSNEYQGNLRIFEADLMHNGSFKDAMHNCKLVYHTASPCSIISRNPQTELVNPAIKGN